MTEKTMRAAGQAAEELLRLRGPKYSMSSHEAEEKLYPEPASRRNGNKPFPGH